MDNSIDPTILALHGRDCRIHPNDNVGVLSRSVQRAEPISYQDWQVLAAADFALAPVDVQWSYLSSNKRVARAPQSTPEAVGREIFNLVCAVAAGEPTTSEALGHCEFVLGYKSFEPLGPACFPG